MNHEIQSRLLTEKDSASYLGLSQAALRELRYKGTGPVVVRWDRKVRYDRKDLDAFIERHKGTTDGR